MVRKYGIVATLMMTFLAPCAASAQALHPAPATPTGWKKKVDRRLPATVFTKEGLEKGETLTIKFYQRKVLEANQSLEEWLALRLTRGRAPMSGKWTGPPVTIRRTGNMATGSRTFQVDSKNYSLQGLAVGVDNVHVRFASQISSNSSSTKKSSAAASRLLFSLLTVEKEAALKEKRGLDIEVNPPRIKNLKAGGTIKPGRYVGNEVYLKDNKVGKNYNLILYETREYELIGKRPRDNESGMMVYSNATGRLDLCNDFENNSSYPDDNYCVYGTEPDGTPVVISREGRWYRRLKWVSASDRPAPSERKRQEEIAKAEAERYKHVTDREHGVRSDEIEAIVYAWETNFRSGAVQLDEQAFLIMKDGRVLDGLPTSPDTLDVAASRSREADRWGWWKKDDDRFTFAWPFRPREYRIPNGKQVVGMPFEKGTRLDGDFGTAKTSVMLASGYSSVTRWGIKLNKNGRFLKYRNGSTQSGGVPGLESLATVVWDDERSVASVLGENATVLSKKKRLQRGTDRMGTYELDGFRLTLRFDDGHIEHHATFTNADQSSVWFEGSNLGMRDE